MNDVDPVRRLAGKLGVPPTYRDALGVVREVPIETLRAVCAGLGFAAQDEAAARQSLAALAEAVATEFAPPVLAVRGSASLIAVPLGARGSGDDRIDWELREESGKVHVGGAAVSDLPPMQPHPIEADAPHRRLLSLSVDLPAGYHELRVRMSGPRAAEGSTRLIVAPERAYQPPSIEQDGRVWALTAQLYALRSPRNWGIGDFTDLSELLACAARCGAAAVGINPLHTLFGDDPERASPYSPSSRFFLNPLYLDLCAIPDFGESEEARTLASSQEFMRSLPQLRECELVDYAGVAALKRRVLDLLYANFRRRHLDAAGGDRGHAFRRFQEIHGEALRRYAIFEALREKLGAADLPMRDWRRWPAELRSPDSPAVRRFAEEFIERVEFFEYAQWQADVQLATATDWATTAALPIGLYCDLALGVDAAGADAWAWQDIVVAGFSVGAPPDAWGPDGQNWGFPPLHPIALRRSGYRMFVEVLRANMRAAGALRIDHVLGLMRTFWIPDGSSPADGAYVHNPFDELLACVILESHRNRCLVVGEDLGTLPEGLREVLQAAGLLSYRLLYFERGEAGRFLRPDEYPAQAVAAVSTHDLPTVTGYWTSHDIELRDRLRDPAAPGSGPTRTERAQDRQLLLAALDQEGLAATGSHDDDPPLLGIHRYLARSQSRLVLVQIEDLIRQLPQVNLPGTDREYPNWRRKLAASLTEIFADPGVHELIAAVNRERAPVQSAGALPVAAAPRRSGPPRATYRVQLNAQFGFADLQRILPYLCDLGVSHVYVSPFLRARAGSTHGYDVVDHNAINPEIGDETSLDRLCATLRALDMGLILDFVPNHMGVGPAENEWWRDVLEWGPASPYADFFDIDWRAPKAELAGKILLPILGDHYGAVLERGELQLRFDSGRGMFEVGYYDHRLPLRPRHYALILAAPAGRTAPHGLQKLAEEFAGLRPEGHGRRRRTEIWRHGRDLQAGLAEAAKAPEACAWIGQRLAAFAGTPGQEASFRDLHRLLERQAYRLAYWRVAADEINYRRFFDISDLVGVRQEIPAVFDRCHRLIGRLIAEDRIHGLRIDHIDGLSDPAGYCRRLREFAAERRRSSSAHGPDRPFYVVLEKILAHHEHLRPDWQADGTTGYDFLALASRLFVDPGGQGAIDAAYREIAGDFDSFDDHARRCRHLVMDTVLSSELNVLARELDRVSEQHWRTRDYTLERLRLALKETIANFPVYRTYVTTAGCSDEDRRHVAIAINRARPHWVGPDREIFDFLLAMLTGDLVKDRGSGYNRNDVLRFAMRVQQYTAPVMAKGMEDTAYYRYCRLLSLNEVGGEPQLFAASPGAFHAANLERQRAWPHGLLATTTHDTKRSEDTRLRLNVLSEIPEVWAGAVRRWRRINRSWRSEVDGRRAPSRLDEYMIYQSLVGAWPMDLLHDVRQQAPALAGFRARLKQFVEKAVREAKSISSWTDPNEGYERACLAFVDAILDAERDNPFLEECRKFVDRIAFPATLGGLSQTVLKCFSPGVPDVYQGSELWDLSLVDPDNRRPVDYHARRLALAGLPPTLASGVGDPATAGTLLARWPDGHLKLYVLRLALQLRDACPALFAAGAYDALPVRGARSPHVVAFARRHETAAAVVAVGRLFVALDDGQGEPGRWDWGDTALHLNGLGTRAFVDIFTGRRFTPDVPAESQQIPISSLFSTLPIAALIATS